MHMTDHHVLIRTRHARLRSVMRAMDVPALLTSDPINIVYACGARNMTVFSLMGPFRFVLVCADGPTILFEFAGCEHLVTGNPVVSEVFAAPGLTALSGPGYRAAIAGFAAAIAAHLKAATDDARLAVEGFDMPVTDALRDAGLTLSEAGLPLSVARLVKQPAEIAVMREAAARVEAAAGSLHAAIRPGVPEVEVWAEFHRHLIATDGEYVSTRLFQSGERTFPYFQEAGPRKMQAGDLVCFDTDALGYMGYAVDFSRTFLCGDAPATQVQRDLHTRAHAQLTDNAALLRPGVTFEEFARAAWPIPPEHRGYGYYCVAHGLGLCGEFPYIPHAFADTPYPLEGQFEPGMVICVESYIGAEAAAQGVKLEDQYLITDTGADRMTTYPFEAALL